MQIDGTHQEGKSMSPGRNNGKKTHTLQLRELEPFTPQTFEDKWFCGDGKPKKNRCLFNTLSYPISVPECAIATP